METTLELGGGVGLSLESEKNRLHASKIEKDYMNMSKEDGELELGLGLSLGGGGVGLKGKGTSVSAWEDCGRILTAGDFQSGFSSTNNWVGISSGSKRERANSPDCVDEAGSVSAAVSQVVGWPPVRTYRMNTLFNQSKKENSNKKVNHGTDKNEATVKERGHLGYVKVNMDGLPIGRKVDVNAHKSYETLAKLLEDMFFNESPKILGSSRGKEEQKQTPKLLDGSSEFVLTYEDKEGDWMLVGDVPWGMFLNTVKRLRIMKTCEANGLALKFQDTNVK